MDTKAKDLMRDGIARIEAELAQTAPSTAASAAAPFPYADAVGAYVPPQLRRQRACIPDVRANIATLRTCYQMRNDLYNALRVHLMVDEYRTPGAVHFVFHGRHFTDACFRVDFGPFAYADAVGAMRRIIAELSGDASRMTATLIGRRALPAADNVGR